MRSSVLAATFLPAVVLALFACSDDETTDTSSSGSGASATTSTAATVGGGGSSSSTAATGGGGGTAGAGGNPGGAGPGGAGGGTGGMAMQSGDCDSDADCPGRTCVEVTPGGFTVCTTTPMTSNGCAPPCTAPAECYPQFDYCGGIVGPMDTCYSDECQMDNDCKGSDICVEKGVLGRPANLCMPIACKHDTDCNAQPGGICAPVESACCGGVVPLIDGLFCVYPNEGCRKASDCPGGYCTHDDSKSFCMPGNAPCPV